MAARQRDISVSEFFAKNRHLLGFDNPRKALLTAIKEAVDNSLDACEDAGILPDIIVEVQDLENDRFRIVIEDNGPGIVKRQIPNIFGKLLYGSKFHRLKMSRGQQGIGISAAGMYGMLTTGKPVEILSRTGPNKPAHQFTLQI
ncbi:MAG: ATP-binding protein, partial [Thermodesulfobacteriota bacterium]|nr:ATP-binding protein [Thermodesulfobacteriota bacterium]